MFRVRAARREDGPVLLEIERLAGSRFREVGLATVADNDPPSLEEVAEYADSGRSWVAVDESDKPGGYVIVDDADCNAHVEQMSVIPEHQNRGIGRSLVAQVQAWASDTRRRAITLTTYTEVCPGIGPSINTSAFEFSMTMRWVPSSGEFVSSRRIAIWTSHRGSACSVR